MAATIARMSSRRIMLEGSWNHRIPTIDRADRADSAPHRISRSHRDRARRELKQRHADRDRDQKGERPGHIPESVDEAQRGREPDLEQAATINHSQGMKFLSLDGRRTRANLRCNG